MTHMRQSAVNQRKGPDLAQCWRTVFGSKRWPLGRGRLGIYSDPSQAVNRAPRVTNRFSSGARFTRMSMTGDPLPATPDGSPPSCIPSVFGLVATPRQLGQHGDIGGDALTRSGIRYSDPSLVIFHSIEVGHQTSRPVCCCVQSRACHQLAGVGGGAPPGPSIGTVSPERHSQPSIGAG